MQNRFRFVLGSVTLILAGSAIAAPPCTTRPKSEWLPESAMKEKIAALGYRDIKVFHKIGSCYEIYGRTADGKKAEVYFNPVDGSVVKENID